MSEQDQTEVARMDAASLELASASGLMQLPIGAGGVQLQTLGQCWDLAKMLVKGELAPKGDNAQAVCIKIQMGLEVGLSYMSALQSISVINGRPAIFGDMPLTIVRGSGLLVDFKETEIGNTDADGEFIKDDDWGWTCEATRSDTGETRSYTFTVDDAKTAGLWKKVGPWTNYPGRMLMFRARSWVLRDLFGDVLKGMRPGEELRDTEDLKKAEGMTVSDPVGKVKTPKPIIDEDKPLRDQFDLTDSALDALHVDVLRRVAASECDGVDCSKMRAATLVAAIKLARQNKRDAANGEREPGEVKTVKEGHCEHDIPTESGCLICGREPELETTSSEDPADLRG